MAANTYTGQLLADYLSDAGPLNADDALLVMQSLVAQAATLHDAGRCHGAILSSNVTIDDRRRPTLPVREPAESISNDGACHWPPELSNLVWESLPTDIARARDELQRLGVSIDPRRIDVFQLGRLACELVSGHAADSYLFSPRGKAHVPVAWRPFIDGLLGYDPAVRLSTCEQVQAALQAAAKDLAKSNERATSASQDTPPRGTGVDVTQNTPLAPHRAASPPALPFATLGHYRIDARLGSGGMGDVYRGYEPTLDRTVAIKVLPAALARQADFVTRFVDEAKAAARLVHPNIVQIYFIGEDAGHHYFSMQYVEGESLADRLKRERRIPLDDALAIVEQIVAGLSVAHRHGMIHRDIKPANILLDARHDRALLADFGLVKSLDNSAGMTATGMVMGTVDYISPEQGRGLAVDGRSDLYSIGVLLYQMLSGRLPFDAESATAMIFQHAYERPRPLEDVAPDVPRGAGAIVHRLMAKDPGERYPTAEALLADVSALRASHEFQPTSVEESESRETSVIVAAPRFDAADDERRLSDALVPLPALRWQDRLRAAFEKHAPDALKNLQNTEQQVDGALALYQSRRDQHALLAREARAVEKELAAQVDALKRAAARSSGEEQRQHQQTVDSLAARLAEQRGEREQIDLRLAKIDATLQKLRSQHSLLQARLRVVAAGHVAADGGARRRHRRHWAQAFACLAVSVPAAVLFMWLDSGGNEPPLPMPVAVDTPSPVHPFIHPSDGWVNLLSMIDVPRDALSGRWLKTADGLKIDNPSGAKGLRIPLSLSGSYELRVRFTRSRGGAPNRGVSVSLPVESRHAVLVLGQAAGNGVGLGGVNGLAAFDRDNPASDRDVPIPPDVEHELTVVVEDHAGEAHLIVSVDGRQVMDWRGSAAALREGKDREGKLQPPQLVLAAWANDVLFHTVELRMLDGAAEVNAGRRPLPVERDDSPGITSGVGRIGPDITPGVGWVDLLPYINLDRDAITGDWSLTPRGLSLENATGVSKYLQLPYSIAGSYELRMRLTHTERDVGGRDRAIVIRFPVDQSRAALMAYTDGRGMGVNSIGGVGSLDLANPTARPNFILTPAVEHEVTLRVDAPTASGNQVGGVFGENLRQAAIRVDVDGTMVINWRGNYTDVGMNDSEVGKRLPAGPLVFLSGFGSNLTFHQLDLRMLDGAAKFAPREPTPTPASNIAAPQAGTWQVNFLSDAQRGVTLVAMPEGRLLLKGSGALAGLYRWDGDRLVMEEPHDKRYQQLVWKWRDDVLVLVEEPPSRPSGSSYVGASMKFISDDTTEAARASVSTRPSRIRLLESPQYVPVDRASP